MQFDKYKIFEYRRAFRLPFFIIRYHAKYKLGLVKIGNTTLQLPVEITEKWSFNTLEKIWWKE